MSRSPRKHHRREPADPREVAVGIVRTLREAGHEAYFAGGCVRDELLGLAPKDYDIATGARPADIQKLFRRTQSVGAAFGVVQVRGRGVATEVATFRTDGVYSDSRRPDGVTFTDAEHDAQRRDFTVNALFLDPLSGPRVDPAVALAGGAADRPAGGAAGAAGAAGAGEPGPQGQLGEAARAAATSPGEPAAGAAVEVPPIRGRVIDFVGGLADLRAGVLRAVGDPAARLAEDHLRALRAVRFAARLGFEVDPATADAVRSAAGELAGISRERLGEELRKILAHPSRVRGAALLEDLGLAEAVLGPAGPRPMAAEAPVASAAGQSETAGGAGAAGAAVGSVNSSAESSADGSAGRAGERLGHVAALAGVAEACGPIGFGLALAALAIDRGRGGRAADGARGADPIEPAEPSAEPPGDGLGGAGGSGGIDGADTVSAWRRGLLLSNGERAELAAVLAGRLRLMHDFAEAGLARQKRWAVEPWFEPARRLVGVTAPETAAAIERRVGELRATPTGLRPEPLLTGEDLIALGYPPGPAFGRVLEAVYDGQLEGGIRDRAAAESAVRGWMDSAESPR